MQVFLTIARKAEVEAAAQEGRSQQTIHLGDGTILKVGMGEEYGTVEGTSQQYQIKWAQDESGNLQVTTAYTLVFIRSVHDNPCMTQSKPDAALGHASTSCRVGPKTNGQCDCLWQQMCCIGLYSLFTSLLIQALHLATHLLSAALFLQIVEYHPVQTQAT